MIKNQNKRNHYIIIAVLLFIGICFVVALCNPYKKIILVQNVETTKISSQMIKVSWSDEYDNHVWGYQVKRRNANKSESEWEEVGFVYSDRWVDGENHFIEDALDSPLPQQYVYRVDVILSNTMFYEKCPGKEVLASNVLICIDPGHYTGRNTIEGELSYGYAEGDFTLEIAHELEQVLKEKYGIDVYMTRTTEHIQILGYKDVELDSRHIALRGFRAAERDCDLFVSLHTNANSNRAHGYPTCLQPIGMNKPLILVNTVGCDDEVTIAVSNSVGVNLAKANYELGIASVEEFVTVEPGGVEEWTGPKNDALDRPGTVYYRHNLKDTSEEPTDYYGVLRGAAVVNKPGIIIEHGFHTVPEMRKEAMQGDLKRIWAEVDAYGIAYGFGFETELEMEGR